MAMAMAKYGVAVLALLSLFSAVMATDYCVYTLFVKTGFLPRAGTRSHISSEFFDANGNTYKITNITDWGASLTNANHESFQRNSLDVFTGLGECLETPICGLHLSTDGTGEHHGWYCDYIDVTSVCSKPNMPCNSHRFTIQQWLATDVYPYQLAAHRDDCVHLKNTASN